MSAEEHQTQDHLVLFIHGFSGRPHHLDYLTSKLNEAFQSQLFIWNPTINDLNLTYDGIDICGERIIIQLEEFIKKKKGAIRKLSVVGYSMGGLVGRYVVGRLYSKGFFKSIIPVNFITFATPHLGVRKPTTSYFNKVYNFVVASIMSQTGLQMTLQDTFIEGYPLIYVMSIKSGVFYKALENFQVIKSYANVINDRTVEYSTAAMVPFNPYIRHENKMSKDKDYPHIVSIDPKYREERPFSVGQQGKQCSAIQCMISGLVSFLKTAAMAFLIPVLMILLGVMAFLGFKSRMRIKLERELIREVQVFSQTSIFEGEQGELHQGEVDELHSVMLHQLNSLPWKKIDVYLPYIANTHGPIICRNPWLHKAGEDVVAHFVDNFNV